MQPFNTKKSVLASANLERPLHPQLRTLAQNRPQQWRKFKAAIQKFMDLGAPMTAYGRIQQVMQPELTIQSCYAILTFDPEAMNVSSESK